MTNHLNKVDSLSRLYACLTKAAVHQFGAATRVPVWWLEKSDHGDSFRGFDYHTNRWLLCDLDLNIGVVIDTRTPTSA